MSKQVVKIDEGLCTKIEALAFEVEARRATVVSCIDAGIQPTNNVFKQYEEEYTRYYVLYQHAKREMEEKYIAPLYPDMIGISWNLQYATRELTITCNHDSDGDGGSDAAKN